jgi:hypothetical protein
MSCLPHSFTRYVVAITDMVKFSYTLCIYWKCVGTFHTNTDPTYNSCLHKKYNFIQYQSTITMLFHILLHIMHLRYFGDCWCNN